MSWTRPEEAPDCERCGVALLPRASSAEPLGAGYWCPTACGDVIFATGKTCRPLPRATAPVLLRPPGRLTWSGKVLRDGSITWQLSGTGTPQDFAEVAKAMVQITMAAERVRERLTGADRWAFSVDGAERLVSRFGEERVLIESTTWSGTTCEACHADIAPRTKVYRASRAGGAGRNPWTAARFCSGCAAPAPRRALALVPPPPPPPAPAPAPTATAQRT